MGHYYAVGARALCGETRYISGASPTLRRDMLTRRQTGLFTYVGDLQKQRERKEEAFHAKREGQAQKGRARPYTGLSGISRRNLRAATDII